MIDGYKVVPFIPAGRQRTMRILLRYLLAHKGEVDEVQIWVNTEDEEDLQYLKMIEDDYFKLVYQEPPFLEPKQLNTGKFYVNTTDEDTIYIRFDDDIVFIDDDFFKNIVKYRIENPDYFLVFANIWNNAIISHIHQKEGNIGESYGKVESYCMDELGWKNPFFAEYIHNILLGKIKKGKTSDLFFGEYKLNNMERFSISCFAFFGKDFKEFGGKVGMLDEEIWLTNVYPRESGKRNVIYGGALVSHFSFFPQKKHLLTQTNLLEEYNKLSKDKLSSNYYKLLGEK